MQPPANRHRLSLADGAQVALRTIRPEDAGIEQAFIARLAPRSRRNRFLSGLRELTPDMLRRFLNVEFPGEMALVATVVRNGREIEFGVARYAAGSAPDRVEFAVVVADEWQRMGIGGALLECLFDVARERGFAAIEGLVLNENVGTLQLMERTGFARAARADDPGVARVVKRLRSGPAAEAAPAP